MPDPKPISDYLNSKLALAAGAIPSGKQGKAEVTASVQGVEVTFSQKVKEFLSRSGFAAREWGGGWTAGARATVMW